jgi:LacI family transcriptional regulator
MIAGVSVSTVSRVINNTQPVDEHTKRQVIDAIDEVNYRPNLLASGLRSKSGNLIGLAVPEISDHSFDMFIKYTEEQVREHHFGLILGDIHNNPHDEADFIDQLIRRNVDGIIFIRVSDESCALEMLDQTDIPYVILDRGLVSAAVPSVVMDNYQCGSIAAEHLLSLGHREIACVTGPLNVHISRERLDGFTSALESNGITLREGAVFEGDFTFDTGVALSKAIRERIPSITAVWAQNDLMAIGVLSGLHDLGVAVPEQVSVVGVDDISLCEMVRPRLTTIRQPFKAMSVAAVDLLMRQRAQGERLSEQIVLSSELVVRESTVSIRSEAREIPANSIKEMI